MKSFIKNLFATIGAVLIVAAIIAPSIKSSPRAGGGSYDTGGYTSVASSTSAIVANSTTVVVGTSTSRQYLQITPIGGTIFCNADNGKAAVANAGLIMIASTSPYVFSEANANLYYGTVNCISAGASVNVTVYQR